MKRILLPLVLITHVLAALACGKETYWPAARDTALWEVQDTSDPADWEWSLHI